MKELDVSGVEITLATREELYSFNPSNDNKKWLTNLDYVTIHAPFTLFLESEDEIVRQIEKISILYKNIHAQNVIIHPYYELPDPTIIKACDFEVSIENLPKKCASFGSGLRKILFTNSQLKLCLDVSHAYTWSGQETANLIDEFGERISQIHLSGTFYGKDHQSLRKVSNRFLHSIQPVKNLDVPIVIEENMSPGSIDYVKEEINYIKTLMNNGVTE